MSGAAARKSGASNPPRKCIFCGGTPISKEHLFADWIRRMFPVGGTSTRTFTETQIAGTTKDRVFLRELNRKIKTGDIISKKLRVVCQFCNNTWMSEIDNAIKPILSKMINGMVIDVSLADQEKIATWVTLKSIVAETMHPEHAYIPKHHIEWFFKNRKPISGWRIHLASISGRRFTNKYEHSHFYRMGIPLVMDDMPTTHYYHFSTFVTGCLLIQAVSGTDEYHLKFRAPPCFLPILPQRMKISWPIAIGIELKDLPNVSRGLFNAMATAHHRR